MLASQVLQIVPVPAKLPEKMGAPLRIKVLLNGKPVAGARVLSCEAFLALGRCVSRNPRDLHVADDDGGSRARPVRQA